jgi:hypothetical protein
VVLLKGSGVVLILATALADVAGDLVVPPGLLASSRAERGSGGRSKSSKRVASRGRLLSRLGRSHGGRRGPHAAERLDVLALSVCKEGRLKVADPRSEGSLVGLECGDAVLKLV